MEIKLSDGEIWQPVRFLEEDEEYRESPVAFIDKNINGTTKFVITRLTGAGKWMRGDLLYYKMNGVEIYTDPKNMIFVDLDNNTMFIREYDKVVQEIAPEDPEEKQYIMLYTDIGYETTTDDEFPLRWEAIIGRTNAYNAIKANAPVIDIDKSIVLVETVKVKDSLTIRQFVEYLKNSDIINDEMFDINDFSGSEYI